MLISYSVAGGILKGSESAFDSMGEIVVTMISLGCEDQNHDNIVRLFKRSFI